MAAPDIPSYLTEINRTFYDQVKTADQKALYVFAIVVAVMIFSASDSKQGFSWITSPDVLSLRWLLSLGFTAALCVTVISTMLVMAPRMRPSSASLFWGAWPAAGERMAHTPVDRMNDLIVNEYIENIQNLAAICKHKYRYVGFAYRGLIATILFYLALVAVG